MNYRPIPIKFIAIPLLLLLLINRSMGSEPIDSLQSKNLNFIPRTEDRWFAEDKYKHFSTSTFLYLTSFYYSLYLFDLDRKKSTTVSAGISVNLGLAKEIYDGKYKRKGYFSYKDLTVDIMGVGLGIIIANNLSR